MAGLMNFLGISYQIAGIAAAVVAVVGGLVIAWRRLAQPRLVKAQTFLTRVDQTINGRPAEHDAYGRETSPAIPALSDQHHATQRALANLADTVAEMHDERSRIDDLDRARADHERRISDLEHARVEQIVNHVDAATARIAEHLQPDDPKEAP